MTRRHVLIVSLVALVAAPSLSQVDQGVTIDRPPSAELVRVESPARLAVELGDLSGRNAVWVTRKLGNVSVAGARVHSLQIEQRALSSSTARLRLSAHVLLEPGIGDRDVYLRWEFMEATGDEVVAHYFHAREYIGASDKGVESESWLFTLSREQFDRVLTGSGKLRLTVDVRPEA